MSKKRRTKTKGVVGVNNLVIISDTHSGCQHALCPPGGVTLDGGGRYHPSRLQRKLWVLWEKFWREFVPEATHGEPYAVVHNGDAIDGVHHGSVEQITHNLTDQMNIAREILEPVVADHAFFLVRGTPAHVGQAAMQEEELAQVLGAIPNEDGQHARYELVFELAAGGVVQCMHHIGTTSSMAYEATALGKELQEMNNEAARWGHAPPDVIVRSHRHRSIEVRLPSVNGEQIAVVTPCWQAKTSYAWKVAGARVTIPQFGGVVVRRKPGGELYTRCFVYTPERSRIER